jgi:hypothetical protein
LAGLTDNIAIAYSTHIDTAIGGLGNDSFIVNADSDRIDGGGGTNTVIFPGDLAQYTLTRQGGTESVSAFGITDTLSNITTLQFADQSVAADSIACFAGGTRIATLHGDVAVEALQLGMQVLTATGAPAPIVWVGYRHINCRRHPRPHDVQPIRVQAHAFGPGRPERDLWLSPDHAVRVDRVLIPIRYLAIGATVRQEAVDSVTYYHVELPTHGLVLAEGLAAESYLDTGNRDAFTNGGGAVRLQADLARRVWDARSCCQLRVDGPDVMVARRTLLARAAMLGHATTDESHLAVMAGGVRCQPTVTGRQWLVRLPPGTRTVRLQSRSWVPGERRAESRDFRQLGVAIGDARLDGIELPPLDERFADGWHAAEAGWRWTDGDAGITVAGHCVLAFNIVSTGQYWVAMDGVPGFGGSSYQVGRTFHG